MKNKNNKKEEESILEKFQNLMDSIDKFGETNQIKVPYYPPIYQNKGCPNCGYCQHCGRGGNNPYQNPSWYCKTGGNTNNPFFGTSGTHGDIKF